MKFAHSTTVKPELHRFNSVNLVYKTRNITKDATGLELYLLDGASGVDFLSF